MRKEMYVFEVTSVYSYQLGYFNGSTLSYK